MKEMRWHKGVCCMNLFDSIFKNYYSPSLNIKKSYAFLKRRKRCFQDLRMFVES